MRITSREDSKKELRTKMARLSKAPSIKFDKNGNVVGVNDNSAAMNSHGKQSKMLGMPGSKEHATRKTLAKIKGIGCEFPLDFLCDDFGTLKTTLIPSEIFK